MRILLAALVTLTGCFTTVGDPSAPAAEGTLRLAPGADIAAFSSLEVHWDRVDGTYGENGIDVLSGPFYFPMEFRTPLGFGRSDAHSYELSVWFSNATWDNPSTEAPAGAPQAIADIAIPSCTDGCAAVRNVELTLEP